MPPISLPETGNDQDMGVRVGASWRTGPGRRAWVTVPGWLLIPYVLFVVPAIITVIVAWYLAVALVKVTAITGQAIRNRTTAHAMGTHPSQPPPRR